jgi:hypothetical protein
VPILGELNGVGSAFDSMGYQAAAANGYNSADFDFKLVLVPRCASNGLGGMAWIGQPGVVVFIHAQDLSNVVAHEFVSTKED